MLASPLGSWFARLLTHVMLPIILNSHPYLSKSACDDVSCLLKANKMEYKGSK